MNCNKHNRSSWYSKTADYGSYETVHKIEFFLDRGDELMKKQQYREAVSEYTTALRHLGGKEKELLELNDYQFVAKIWSNRSAAHHCMGDYQQALRDAKAAISIVPKWHKGYIRQAKSYASLGSYKESMRSYIDAIERVEDCEDVTSSQEVAIAYLDVAKKFAEFGSDTATLRRVLNVGFKKFGVDLFFQAMANHARFDTLLPILRCDVKKEYTKELKDKFFWFDPVCGWAPSQEENLIEALKQGVITTTYMKISMTRNSSANVAWSFFSKVFKSVLHFMIAAACITGSTKLLSYGITTEFNRKEPFETFDTCGDPLLHQIFKDSLNTKLFVTTHVCAVLELLSRHSCVNLLVCNRDRKTVLQVHEFRQLQELRLMVQGLAAAQKKTAEAPTKKSKRTPVDNTICKMDQMDTFSMNQTSKVNRKAKHKLHEKPKGEVVRKAKSKTGVGAVDGAEDAAKNGDAKDDATTKCVLDGKTECKGDEKTQCIVDEGAERNLSEEAECDINVTAGDKISDKAKCEMDELEESRSKLDEEHKPSSEPVKSCSCGKVSGKKVRKKTNGTQVTGDTIDKVMSGRRQARVPTATNGKCVTFESLWQIQTRPNRRKKALVPMMHALREKVQVVFQMIGYGWYRKPGRHWKTRAAVIQDEENQWNKQKRTGVACKRRDKQAATRLVDRFVESKVLKYYSVLKGGVSEKLVFKLIQSKLTDMMDKHDIHMTRRYLKFLEQNRCICRQIARPGAYSMFDELYKNYDMIQKEMDRIVQVLKSRRIVGKRRRIRIMRRVHHARFYKRHENCVCKLYVRDCKHTAHPSVPSAVMWNYWVDMLQEPPRDHPDEFEPGCKTVMHEEILRNEILDKVTGEKHKQIVHDMTDAMLSLSPMFQNLKTSYQCHLENIDYKMVAGATADPALCLKVVQSDFNHLKTMF